MPVFVVKARLENTILGVWNAVPRPAATETGGYKLVP